MIPAVEVFVYLVIGIASIFIIGSASQTRFLNSALKRGLAGSTISITSGSIFVNYTNSITFLELASKGQFGWQGYLFLITAGLLVVVWIQNLVKYRQAIV